MPSIVGSPFDYDETIQDRIQNLDHRVREMRASGSLDATALKRISQFFRVRTIYNSNAIEGNQLTLGETALVVEQGITISGKPLKDSLEAKNLSEALTFLEELASERDPILEVHVRQIHAAVLRGIDDVNAGQYRSVEVKITGSEFSTEPPESIPSAMASWSAWLRKAQEEQHEATPLEIAAAAHTWFVQIHPFIDGNGRTARILLNLLLMRGGYPIAVISKEDRFRYYEALETSQTGQLTPFLSLMIESVEEALEEWEAAAKETVERREAVTEMAQMLAAPQRNRRISEFAVFEAAMNLLKEQFERFITELAEAVEGQGARVFFRQFSGLDVEKYIALSAGRNAKQTWFFRVDFRVETSTGERTARYLFWFGRPGYRWTGPRPPVVLLVSREDPPGSYGYESLNALAARGKTDLPEIREIGFADERFYGLTSAGGPTERKVEDLTKDFVAEVISRNFGSR